MVSFNSNNLEYLLVEINLRKKKWLVCCYSPHRSFSKDFLTAISKGIDWLSSRFEKFLIIGDYNCEIHEESIYNFWQICDFKNLINDPI